jgi:hypothetical protein
VNSPAEAQSALKQVETADLEGLATAEILELARTLQPETPDLLPTGLLQRLSTMNAQVVTRIAAGTAPPALIVGECVRALKLIRWERETARLQQEIDRLQQSGQTSHDLNPLLDRKTELAIRIQELR